ncbi:MAG: HIT family protein [Pseudomonadales bacterium]
MNSTLTTFGYPDTLIYEGQSWVVLLRPKQATLGALVLACKEEALALSAISNAARTEMATLMCRCEALLETAFEFDKINYLMLMMIDPHVHYHVLPRYSATQKSALPALAGVEFADAGWPALPRLDLAAETTPEQNAALVTLLREQWTALS